MSHDADLLLYLPEFLRKYLEMRETMASETEEACASWAAVDQIIGNAFLETADAAGIARFESILGIVPSENDDLTSRRMRLRSRFLSLRPYTKRRLEEILTDLCGDEGYSLTVTPESFSVDIKISLGVKNQLQIVSQLLEYILPANLIYAVELLFNIWMLIRAKTWNDIATEKWSSVKEDVL